MDVHWTPAIVWRTDRQEGRDVARRVADGRILPGSRSRMRPRSARLTLYDVVLTHVTDGSGKTAARADLRVRPVVQGAVIVLENKTGRVLAMTGGFSYPLSSSIVATPSCGRQPGSAIKR